MKYMKSAAGDVYAYAADGSQDASIIHGLRPMTDAEVRAHLAPPQTLSQAPQACTPAQGLVALFALKQITEDDVLTAISKIADPVAQYTARIGYQRATTWERGSPTMQAMAQLLQLSEADLDELFAYAAAVQV